MACGFLELDVGGAARAAPSLRRQPESGQGADHELADSGLRDPEAGPDLDIGELFEVAEAQQAELSVRDQGLEAGPALIEFEAIMRDIGELKGLVEAGPPDRLDQVADLAG